MPTSRWSCFSTVCICFRSFRSSAPSGSSSSSTCGLQHERAGQRDALLLAARELAGAGLLAAGQPDQLEHLGRPGVRISASATLPLAQPEGDVLEHVQVREQRVVLEHGVDRPPVRPARRSCRRRARAPCPRGLSSPAIIRSVVVLPQPLGPISEKNSPSAISRSMPGRPRQSPKRRSSCSSVDGRRPCSDRRSCCILRASIAAGSTARRAHPRTVAHDRRGAART